MNLEMSKEQLKELEKIQRNVVGTPAYVKVTAIIMLAKHYSPGDVSSCLGVDLSTAYRYVKAYRECGVDGLMENKHKGYFGKLTCLQISALRKELRSKIYTDAKSVCAWVKWAFGVDYSAKGMVELLNRIGFAYKKTREIPCEADAKKQEEFMNELSETLESLEDGAVVYYADGVHPTHNSRSTYGWIEKGEEFMQPTVSGRDRVNINGLLNAHDPADVIAHMCDSVNAQSTKELFQAALEKHPDAPRIVVIMDNARYYHNKELNEWMKGTRITPVYLPPYSPNLNLIERLWKFLRKKVINTNFYRTKELFQSAIKKFFDRIGDYKAELESLLTLRFSLVNSQSISL